MKIDPQPTRAEVGQIWDDVFGEYTWEVIMVTNARNVILSNRYKHAPDWEKERVIPEHRLIPLGNGWACLG